MKNFGKSIQIVMKLRRNIWARMQKSKDVLSARAQRFTVKSPAVSLAAVLSLVKAQ